MPFKNRLFRAAMWLTQLGLSIITPPVLLMLLGVWLQNRFALGNWVLIVAIVVGLLSSFCSALSFYRSFTRKNRRPDENGGVQNFNRHV